LEERLGVARSEIRGLLQQADRRSLLRRLTIAYDYEQWLKQSSEKGCLVIMTCVEHTDLTRDPAEVADAYGETVDAIKRSVLNGQQRLDRVIVVPNGHLAPRTAPVPWEQALALLREIPPALEKRGYEPTLNSYGFSKIIRLAIHAHKLGYVLRVV
jgi:sugar phosphate isomerase/epimerase